MRAPRIRLSARGARPRISVPLKRTLPRARPLRASSPITDMNTWLLPEPDSPTMPSASPAPTRKLTSLAALTSPSGVAKVVVSEYVDVAKAFFDGREAGFANGLLDAIGKDVRAKG